MRILYTVRDFTPAVGGEVSYMSNLARSIANRGRDVSVITSTKSSIKRKERYSNFTVYRIGHIFDILGMPFLNPFKFNKLINKIRPDLIHTSGVNPFADGTSILAKINSIPIILTHHGDPNLEKFISRTYIRLEKNLMKYFDVIITSTQEYRDILQNRGIPSKKIKVIPVGVEWKRFNSVSEREKMELKKELNVNNEKIILFVGGLTKGQLFKRPDYLLKALSKINRDDIILIMVGRGELLEHYKEFAKKLGIKNKVLFKNNVSDEELPAYYHISDLFVLPSPSNQEAFGIVLLEAMAAGCPVITSDKAGGRILIEESDCGFTYNSKNINDLSNKIEELLTNEKMLSEKSLISLKHSKNYDWKEIASKVEKVYKCFERKI
ncbi:MAG: glycosyltransferase family 4 protein [Candidatus Lokiarchaeia archaeon]